MAKISQNIRQTRKTLKMAGIEYRSECTTILIPSHLEMILKGRKARKTRRNLNWLKKMETRVMLTVMKSRQYHGSVKYRTKPSPNHLASISMTKIVLKIWSE